MTTADHSSGLNQIGGGLAGSDELDAEFEDEPTASTSRSFYKGMTIRLK
jgi:hypothetical protein